MIWYVASEATFSTKDQTNSCIFFMKVYCLFLKCKQNKFPDIKFKHLNH